MAWSEENGIPFISIDEFDIDPAARRRFTEDKPGAWSSALLQDGTSRFVLFNSVHSSERIRSNLAHEVAHFEADHALTDSWMTREGKCGGASKAHEADAAELAGALLIPAEVARQHAIRSGHPSVLAARYGVSIQMAEGRMRLSGGFTIRDRALSKRLAHP